VRVDGVSDPAALLPLVDVLLAFTVLEIVALLLWRLRDGRGLAWADFGPNLLSGLCLMAALRCALTPGAGLWLLACLAGAGVFHAIELHRRLALPPRRP
jgi:hypothetical protein